MANFAAALPAGYARWNGPLLAKHHPCASPRQ
jgi:hypothetical protein